jgi:hypothetical protein
MDPEMMHGLILAVFLISMIIAPIYCCQVSDEEYQKIMFGYHERKKQREE